MNELNKSVRAFINQHGDNSVITIDERTIYRQIRELDEMSDKEFAKVMNELTFDFCSVENRYEVWGYEE